MSGASTLSRNSQRRTTQAEDIKNYQYSTPPTPTQSSSSYSATQQNVSTRSSSGSGSGGGGGGGSTRSGSGRRRDVSDTPDPSFWSRNSTDRPMQPSQQLSQIEKSVTHLLIATKQLLETLTQWSRHQATEGDVSDVYVRLGYEFNIACRAFTSIGVDISDLGNVPDLLRTILEDTLSQDPSPASLDRYLPRIRDIIINLLHGLKRKQQKLRTRQSSNGQTETSRQSGMVGSASGNGDLDGATASSEVQSRLSAASTYVDQRAESYSSSYQNDEMHNSQRTSSVPADGIPQDHIEVSRPESMSNARQMAPSMSEYNNPNDSAPSLPIQLPSPTTTSMQNPGPPPLPPSDVVPKDFPAPPPVPPAEPREDALAKLAGKGDLERRASRRYSAYQIQKHLGQSPGSMPMIPPTQHGPIPNRGKEQRDSLNAVRSRSSLIRSRSTRFTDSSPSRTPTQQTTDNGNLLEPTQQHQIKREGSPLSQEATLQNESTVQSPTKPDLSATLSGPLDMSTAEYAASPAKPPLSHIGQLARKGSEATLAAKDEATEEPFVPSQSPEPGKPLTLFLQYKSKIKKCVLPDGASGLTVGRLQLAFIDKFAWHTYNNGVELPDIYIQDPVSGVRHELEDLSDVKDRTVLVLNVEAVDEVKRHFDGALGGIRSAIDGMRTIVEKQQTSLQEVSTKQEETTKEMARLASLPPATGRAPGVGRSLNNSSRTLSGGHMTEVQTLRRDLAVMRQTLASFTSGIKSSIDGIKQKAEIVKEKAANASLPSSEGESGRAYVNAGKKTVGDDSESLVNRVDDLQDLVEDLRKDVTRGVRPLPEQVKDVTTDIETATNLLNKMKDMVKREKPVWTKIWEKELELVCTDREFLTMQEELIIDLEDDLEKANQTFALVQEATKQQTQPNSDGSGSGGGIGGVALRNVSRGLGGGVGAGGEFVDPETARAGMLGEVKALQPNHEGRLEAIERAEKARKKELANRKDGAFTKELNRFVEDGRLRKTGGFEEIERVRLIRDDQNLKVTWDVEQEDKAQRKKERAEKKKRDAAERAAALQAAAEEEAAMDAALANGEHFDVEGGPSREGEDGLGMDNYGHEHGHGQHDLDPHHDGGGAGRGSAGSFYEETPERNGLPHEDGASEAYSMVSGQGEGSQQGSAAGEGETQRKSWLPSIFSG